MCSLLQRMRSVVVILILFFGASSLSHAQTLGGSAVFQFLKLPSSALQSATGRLNVSLSAPDVGATLINPALLHDELHGTVGASFLNLFGAGRALHAAGVNKLTRWKATSVAGVTFVDYGQVPQTDAAGNELGTFSAREYALQAGFSKSYKERWYYGGTLKFAGAQYGRFSSFGLMADVGLRYSDTVHGLQAGFVMRNAGAQLRRFETASEELPFEVVAGVTKKLEKAPLAFSLTGQYLHRLRVSYPDSLTAAGRSTVSLGRELFNHLIVATHVYISSQIQVHAGYNALRAFELRNNNFGSGLNGFSGGLLVQLKAVQIQYASTWYNRRPTNQVSLNVQLARPGTSGL